MKSVAKKPLFLITGVNGSGKTTLIKKLLKFFQREKLFLVGDYWGRRMLPGADALTTSEVWEMLTYRDFSGFKGIVLEGQKYAHSSGFDYLGAICQERDWVLHICWISCDVEEAYIRAKARGAKAASPTLSAIEKQYEKISETYVHFPSHLKCRCKNAPELERHILSKLGDLP